MIQNLLSSPASFGGVAQGLFDSVKRIASGQRVQSAADDPAGAAVVAKLESITASDRQAVRATNDGMSITQSIDGAAESAQANLVEMRKLAVAAASDTIGGPARQSFQDQLDQLSQELDRSAASTEFNGMPLTDGSLGTVEVVASADGNDTIAIDTADLTATNLGVDSLDLSTSAGAQAAIDALDTAIERVSEVRSDAGAQHNRLASAAEAGSARVIDRQSAASRIGDADIALEVSRRANLQLQQQASTAAKVQSRHLTTSAVSQLLA